MGHAINATCHAASDIYCRLHEEPIGVRSIVRRVLAAAPIVQASIPNGFANSNNQESKYAPEKGRQL